FGALVDDDNGTSGDVSVYRIAPGAEGTMEAKLVSSTAAVNDVSGDCDDDDYTKPDLAQYRTGFSQYDFSLNPYNGCQFACKYCYAGVYKDYADLPRDKWQGRIVLGTHVDPYQPREAKDERTRDLLKQLVKHTREHQGKITKVGIFTRGTL